MDPKRSQGNRSPRPFSINLSQRSSKDEEEEQDDEEQQRRTADDEQDQKLHLDGRRSDIPVAVVVASASLSPAAIARSSSGSSLSARRRVSSLGTTGSSDDLVMSQPQALVRNRHQTSPLTSPTFHSHKSFDSGNSAAANGPGTSAPASGSSTPMRQASGRAMGEHQDLDLGGTTLHPHLVQHLINSRRSTSLQKRRLVAFGTIVTSLAVLLWFSVYQRHSIWGSSEEQKVSVTEKGPWMILTMVLSFLGLAAIYAGVTLKQEEDLSRVRVVQGDAMMGMIAEQGELESSTDYIEPTSPQRAWAIKALSEVNDRL